MVDWSLLSVHRSITTSNTDLARLVHFFFESTNTLSNNIINTSKQTQAQ